MQNSERKMTAGLVAGLVFCCAAFGSAPGTRDAAPTGAPTVTLEPDGVTHLSIPVGRSAVIEPGWMISEVAVADETIADVKVLKPDRVMVIGKEVGATDVTLWDPDGNRWEARVTVHVDLERLRQTLERVLPDSSIKLEQSEGVLIVTGTLGRAEQAEDLHRFLEAAEIKYVDMTRVAGLQQVMIRVRVAEANRIAIRSLGSNAVHAGDSFFGGSTIGGNRNSIDIGIPGGQAAGDNLDFGVLQSASVGDAVTLFAGFPGLDFELFIEALEDNQYLRTLAEPTLVAMSGEKASFLAGGEFPIPIASAGIGGATQITIEWKEFGVRLNFLPTVLGDGTIRMQVAPEVSDLSDVGAVQVEGFRIPSLLTRRAATTLSMRSGQTFAMAGLLDQNIAARSQKVPGLGNIPILGRLFSSVRYERGETELVVLATVELVEPMDTQVNLPVPGDTHHEPDSWELYSEGMIHGAASEPRPPAVWASELGLDRLVGPGAWATHGMSRTSLLPEHKRVPWSDVDPERAGEQDPERRDEGSDPAGTPAYESAPEPVSGPVSAPVSDAAREPAAGLGSGPVRGLAPWGASEHAAASAWSGTSEAVPGPVSVRVLGSASGFMPGFMSGPLAAPIPGPVPDPVWFPVVDLGPVPALVRQPLVVKPAPGRGGTDAETGSDRIVGVPVDTE